MGVVTKIKQFLSGRDAAVARLQTLEREQNAAAAERQRAIAAVQAEVDELEEPRRRLERLTAEHAAAGAREAAELADAMHQVREAPSRELERFEARVERLFARVRQLDPPQAEIEVNNLTDQRETRNLDAIARHLALGPLLARMRVECRDSLWRLGDEALRARVAELQAELEAAAAGTALEHEAA